MAIHNYFANCWIVQTTSFSYNQLGFSVQIHTKLRKKVKFSNEIKLTKHVNIVGISVSELVNCVPQLVM